MRRQGGKRLKAWREERGLSQAQLAEKLRTDQPTISKIEAGRHEVRLSLAIRIAKLTGGSVSVEILAA